MLWALDVGQITHQRKTFLNVTIWDNKDDDSTFLYHRPLAKLRLLKVDLTSSKMV